MKKMNYYMVAMLVALMGVMGVWADGEPSASDNSVAVSLNTFGILKINSATTNTMIAVPWTWYSKKEEDAGMVRAYKLVKTTNLTAGDMLYAYVSDGHYAAWCATATKTPGILSWEPVITVLKSGSAEGTVQVIQENVNSNPITLPLAAGVWLSRQNPLDKDGNILPFWIYAQSVDQPVTTTIAPITDKKSGKTESVRSTMLGNPYAQATAINQLNFTTGAPADTDTIIVPNGTAASTYLQYRAPRTAALKAESTAKRWIWSEMVRSDGRLREVEHDDVTVPAGLAFWYVRRGSGDLVITWQRPSSTPANSGN